MHSARQANRRFTREGVVGLGQIEDMESFDPSNLDLEIDESTEFGFAGDPGPNIDFEESIIAVRPVPVDVINIELFTLFDSLDPFAGASHTFDTGPATDFVNSVLDLTSFSPPATTPTSVLRIETADVDGNDAGGTWDTDSFRFAENLDNFEKVVDAQLDRAVAPEASTFAIWTVLVGIVVAYRKRSRALI
jgi:hypothetical protein